MVTRLAGLEDEPDLAYTSKKDQADLLCKVLAASDEDADEEDNPILIAKVSIEPLHIFFTVHPLL